MRLTGWVLLLIGGLLCATIAWAALGFLLMGVGLISLQVAERRRRPAGDLVPAGTTGFVPPRLSAGLQPPTLDPFAGQGGSAQRQPRRVAWPDRKGGPAYDQEAWRRLVEGDPDLARIAKVLADYGPQYVDELAASYLAAPDKKRLGAIVDGIIARARGNQPAPPAAPPEASRPPPLPPRPEPKQVAAPAAKPATPPSNPAGALEASLLGAVEEASARIAAERAGLFKSGKKRGKATDSGPSTPSQQEPAVGPAPRDAELPPRPADPPGHLEASLIAAVSEAAARRTDTFKPTASPPPAKPEPRAVATDAPKPQPPPLAKASPVKPAPAKPTADDLDESLLAALAEISGQKVTDESKHEAGQNAGPKDPPGSPIDDGLSEMVKKFAPDSNFLRKP